MKSDIGAWIFLLAVSAASGQTPSQMPLAAFSSGNSVFLVSKVGEIVSNIKLPIKVGELSFSPDLKKLVVITPHPDESGGKMYLYSLASKRLQRIPAHAVVPASASSEVYSEPQFSEDGATLFFNTHPQAEGDLAETNGPLAELDLKSLRAKAVESTTGLITDGFLLSPNGRELLLWDEEKVIDTNGTTLFDLHDFKLQAPFKWALDEAWIGNGCVLYRAGKSATPRIKGETSYFVLNLKSLSSASASKVVGLSDKELEGVVSYRFPYAIIKGTQDSAGDLGSGFVLVSPGGTRTRLATAGAAVVQILPNKLPANFPSECR
ncbi:MAG: hypothetical protein P4N24_14235 [Acidobacteriota bacterium]|nr:hypothetical protein [Acidobacteriota bacterium]